MTYHKLIRFLNDAAGLEKILRLLQSISQVLSAYALTSDDELYWLFLRRQFALARRYFRFFKFLDCFSKALSSSHNFEILAALKWSFMGLYLGLESLTILDAIGIYPTPWAEKRMLDANKCWWISLLCSIALGLLQLYTNFEKKTKDGRRVRRTKILKGVKKRLLADVADLFIPGHVTGYLPTNTAMVGMASVVSTALSSKDIWDRM